MTTLLEAYAILGEHITAANAAAQADRAAAAAASEDASVKYAQLSAQLVDTAAKHAAAVEDGEALECENESLEASIGVLNEEKRELAKQLETALARAAAAEAATREVMAELKTVKAAAAVVPSDVSAAEPERPSKKTTASTVETVVALEQSGANVPIAASKAVVMDVKDDVGAAAATEATRTVELAASSGAVVEANPQLTKKGAEKDVPPAAASTHTQADRIKWNPSKEEFKTAPLKALQKALVSRGLSFRTSCREVDTSNAGWISVADFKKAVSIWGVKLPLGGIKSLLAAVEDNGVVPYEQLDIDETEVEAALSDNETMESTTADVTADSIAEKPGSVLGTLGGNVEASTPQDAETVEEEVGSASQILSSQKTEHAESDDFSEIRPIDAAMFTEVGKQINATHVAAVGGVLELDVTRDGSVVRKWTLDLKNGNGSVFAGSGGAPDTTITLSEDTLEKWLSGELDPMMAFMSGLLTVTGDQMLTMKLGVLKPLIDSAAAVVSATATVDGDCAVGSGDTPVSPEAAEEEPAGSKIFAQIAKLLKSEHVTSVGGIFQLDVTTDGVVGNSWTIDLKNESGALYAGHPRCGVGADTTITMSDETLTKWLAQEIDPMTAFMSGLLTVAGDQMLTMKLGVLKPLIEEAVSLVNAIGDTEGATGDASLVSNIDKVAAESPPVGAAIFAEINKLLTAEHVAAVGGVFRLDVTKPDDSVGTCWTIDLKSESGSVYAGSQDDGGAPDTTITMSEDTLEKWLSGELDPVMAFMSGLLTVTGDQMLTIKLGVLKPLIEAATASASAADVHPPSTPVPAQMPAVGSPEFLALRAERIRAAMKRVDDCPSGSGASSPPPKVSSVLTALADICAKSPTG